MEFPFFPEATVENLDGLWNFKWLGNDFPENINAIAYDEKGAVPGVFDTTPLHFNEKGVGVYQREFSIADGGSYEFYCGGAGLVAKFYIDGKLVAKSFSAYSPNGIISESFVLYRTAANKAAMSITLVEPW